jgi:centrosomin
MTYKKKLRKIKNFKVFDLNQVNESHKARLQDLEIINKEFQGHVVVCETSDSTPSSSGISSIPLNTSAKQIYEDLHKYNIYNVSEV